MDITPVKIPDRWEALFTDETMTEIKEIQKILNKDMKKKNYTEIYPPREDIYKAFEVCDPKKIKIVVLGEEPYSDECDCKKHCKANGLAWAVRECCYPTHALKNVIKVIDDAREGSNEPPSPETPKTLIGFDKILFLNISLTVRKDKPKSHISLWLGFIQKVFTYIDSINPKCIYMMWGQEAKSMGQWLNDSCIKILGPSPSNYNSEEFLKGDYFNKAIATTGIKETLLFLGEGVSFSFIKTVNAKDHSILSL